MHGDINDEIFRHLLDDALVVADLSDHNPNVYYELAIRHAVRKPFIHVTQAGDKLPFDVQGMRAIQVDLESEASVARARTELSEMLDTIDVAVDITTPVPKPWTLVQSKAVARRTRPD